MLPVSFSNKGVININNQVLAATIYDNLTSEFENNLSRNLTDPEKGFIKWISQKHAK